MFLLFDMLFYRVHVVLVFVFLEFTTQNALLGRSQWCQWSEWSRCSPEPCPTDKREAIEFSKLRLSMLDENSKFCVHNSSRLASVQASVGGVMHTRIPTKRRIRKCQCKVKLIDLFFNACTSGVVYETCLKCNFDEVIYNYHRDVESDKPIPECNSSSLTTLGVVKIAVTVLGGVVFFILIFCIVRALIVSKRSRRRRSATNGTIGPTRPSITEGAGCFNGGLGYGFHEASRLQHGGQDVSADRHATGDFPPAYKDIILTPTVDFRGTSSVVGQTMDTPVCSYEQVTDPLSPGHHPSQPSSIPPPPPYEEVSSSTEHSRVTATTHRG